MPTSINASGITFPNGTTQTTAASGAGTVTSVATGNGLQGGTITTSGTLSVACPTFNTVGSYVYARYSDGNPTAGSNYSAGAAPNQIASFATRTESPPGQTTYNLSGTWKWMASGGGGYDTYIGLACRVS